VVQSDPRDYLTRLETQKMIDDWKFKAPKQATWYLKHPTQVVKHAKMSGNGQWNLAMARLGCT